MLIAIAIAEEIRGSKDCIGARTQQRTSLGLVSHINFDDLRLPSGLQPKMKNSLISNLSKRPSPRAPGGRREPEEISLVHVGNQAHEGPLLASWVLAPIQSLKSFEILGSLLQW